MNLKKGKKPGPDEIYIWLADRKLCLHAFTESLNYVMTVEPVIEKWYESKTALIPKYFPKQLW